MKRLPIGIQTFSNLIEDGYLYVDKTRDIYNLIQAGKLFFLSRPRRFGKSLLLSTLKSIFAGEKEYFKGLYIYDKIDWIKHPVIHIDFSGITHSEGKENFKKSLKNYMIRIANEYSLEISKDNPLKDTFIDIVMNLSKINRVVILIDECDKPIIDYITDIEKAKENREVLRELYSTFKDVDDFIKFLLITGVSKFSKVSIFSGLNNLWDITIEDKFATMLGYTQEELEHYFSEGIEELSKKENINKEKVLEDIMDWYNGYSWDGVNKVYNPFSILQLFASMKFGNYWFSSGTPTFLIDLIKKSKIEIPEIERREVGEYLFDSYDIENMDIYSLLFQTGYLTIVEKRKKGVESFYILDYPNLEVKNSLLTYLTSSFIENTSPAEVSPSIKNLKVALEENNIKSFIKIIKSILSSIPYNLHLKKEAYYHSLFYMILKLIVYQIDLEVLTDKGRIDGVLKFEDKIYVIEFKLGTPDKALKQIKSRKYYEKFLAEKKKIILLGVGFKAEEIDYKIEELRRK